ncbi:hypothetical protein PanWU01x14_218080 [Parasponia andersonii]|uniref:Uncharacterized protein n=1 Tax=Parasponia andersonii TaxID=3476 RepID=A0A2P5BQL5_PARAD|nr:hypothetical protein PanWU01x14_218080 [Parasponia andersonii]
MFNLPGLFIPLLAENQRHSSKHLFYNPTYSLFNKAYEFKEENHIAKHRHLAGIELRNDGTQKHFYNSCHCAFE